MNRINFIKSLIGLPFIGKIAESLAPSKSVHFRKVTFPSGKILRETYYLSDGIPTEADIPFAYTTGDRFEVQYYQVKNVEKLNLKSFQGQIDDVFARNGIDFLNQYPSYWE